MYFYLQPGDASIVGFSNCKVTQAVTTKTIFGTGLCFMCFMKSLGSFPHRLTKSRQSKLRKDSGTSKDFLKNGVNNHTFLYNHGFPFRIGLVECKPE